MQMYICIMHMNNIIYIYVCILYIGICIYTHKYVLHMFKTTKNEIGTFAPW